MENHGDNNMKNLTKEEVIGRLSFAKIQIKSRNSKLIDDFNQILHGETFGSESIEKISEIIDSISKCKNRTIFLDDLCKITAYEKVNDKKEEK
tara:strand:- start:498 stop:776 length:279 start_codon:yes stop_codon:yes gene_type:complete